MALRLCDDGHDEIVFNDYIRNHGNQTCPLCAAKVEIAQWEEEGAKLVA